MQFLLERKLITLGRQVLTYSGGKSAWTPNIGSQPKRDVVTQCCHAMNDFLLPWGQQRGEKTNLTGGNQFGPLWTFYAPTYLEAYARTRKMPIR